MGIRHFAGEPRKIPPAPNRKKTANPKPQKTAKLGLGWRASDSLIMENRKKNSA